MIKSLCTLLLSAAVSALPALASEPTRENIFIADYEILDDQPDCNAPEDIAIKAVLSAPSLAFQIHVRRDDQPIRTIRFRQDGSYFDKKQQPIGVGTRLRARASAKRLKVGRSESDEATASLLAQRPKLSFDASVTYCLSYHGFRLLDGYWHARLQVGDTVHSKKEPIQKFGAVDERNSLIVSLTLPANFIAPMSGNKFRSRTLRPRDVTRFSVDLHCFRFPFEDQPAKRFIAQSHALFALTKDKDRLCTDPECMGTSDEPQSIYCYPL